MIEIVSATRLSEDKFHKESALGLSLQRLSHDSRLVSHIAYNNNRGLPEVFNERILAQGGNELQLLRREVEEDIDLFKQGGERHRHGRWNWRLGYG